MLWSIEIFNTESRFNIVNIEHFIFMLQRGEVSEHSRRSDVASEFTVIDTLVRMVHIACKRVLPCNATVNGST